MRQLPPGAVVQDYVFQESPASTPSKRGRGRAQDSTISVFTRDRDGTLRHSYSAHPWVADEVKARGIDLLTPVYDVLDLTPQGRDDWYAKPH